jgi:hypothetical protein
MRLPPLMLALLLLPVLVAGCTRLPEPGIYFGEKAVPTPRLDAFTVCHGYDCTFHSEIKLGDEEWAAVRALFEPPPASAEAERRAIAAAIARFEDAVGRRIGTSADIPGLAFIAAGDPTQQDCIDESTNTTVYLELLAEAGLMRRHKVAPVASRGVFLDFRWYHQTAVIQELETGTEWAVDSWFEPNGVPPIVTTLHNWQTSYGRPTP